MFSLHTFIGMSSGVLSEHSLERILHAFSQDLIVV